MPKCQTCGHDVVGVDLINNAFYWIKFNEAQEWNIARAHKYNDENDWFFYDTFGSEYPALEVGVIYSIPIVKTLKKFKVPKG